MPKGQSNLCIIKQPTGIDSAFTPGPCRGSYKTRLKSCIIFTSFEDISCRLKPYYNWHSNCSRNNCNLSCKNSTGLINKIVQASFNSTMDPLTINETTFTIRQDANAFLGMAYHSTSTANTFYISTITTYTKNIYRHTVPAFISVTSNQSLLSFKNNNYEILEQL